MAQIKQGKSSEKTTKPTHSGKNTPSLQSGPKREVTSKLAAVASLGIHSSILVIIAAMLLIDTSTSNPLTTPRQLESLPPKPSGRNKDSWKSSPRTTGARISSISLSGSKRRAKSCRNCSTSEGARVVWLLVELERSGADSAERERRGWTSSAAPRVRLRCFSKSPGYL